MQGLATQTREYLVDAHVWASHQSPHDSATSSMARRKLQTVVRDSDTGFLAGTASSSMASAKRMLEQQIRCAPTALELRWSPPVARKLKMIQ